MAKKAASIEQTLERMKKAKDQSSGNYLKIDDGESVVIRVLPPVGEMVYFFQQYGRHYPPGKDQTALTCLSFTTDGGLECPICELSNLAFRNGDRETAKDWRVRKSYNMNVVVRNKHGDDELKRWTPGVKIFTQLYGIIGDEDYGEIYDVGPNGQDVKVTRTGTGLDTTYQVIPGKRNSPLAETQEEIDAFLKDAQDLAKLMDDLPSADALLESAGMAEVTEDDDF